MDLADDRLHLEYPQSQTGARKPALQTAGRCGAESGIRPRIRQTFRIALRTRRRLADNHLGLHGMKPLSRRGPAAPCHAMSYEEKML
jgi:hypothetical protein